MNPGQQAGGPITREQWVEIVAGHSAPASAERGRRQHPRHPSAGSAQLAYTVDDGYSELPRVRDAGVLEVSAGGLTLRGRERIPLDEPVVIELSLGTQPVTLWGRIVHCTPTAGAFKLGVRLEFPQERGEGRPRAD
jgi:hypothetical protein